MQQLPVVLKHTYKDLADLKHLVTTHNRSFYHLFFILIDTDHLKLSVPAILSVWEDKMIIILIRDLNECLMTYAK